jgi:asparagine synthase (glutamine-hydrolysing)
MISASGKTIIAFNGEIYNHLEIRSRLDGIAWRGHSDTETLLEAWERFGEGCLGLLRGMFAFAIYDIDAGSLCLARDRMGIKPLYYCLEGGNLLFASETRALLKGNRPRLDEGCLANYLATGHLSGTGKIGDGIEIFPPATLLRLDRGACLDWKKWWKFPFKTQDPHVPISRKEATTEVLSLIENAVDEHLLSDVPVGAFLSGGIDSSIVCLCAAKSLGKSLHTFCVGFPDSEYDERSVARLVAEKAGSSHTEIEVGPKECQQWAMEAVAAMDVPSVDALNTYIVAKAVKQTGIKVALSGLGGDELFCGYPSFLDVPWLAFLEKLPTAVARSLISFLPANVREKLEGATSFDPFNLALLRRRWWSNEAFHFAGVKEATSWPSAGGSFQDSIQAISAAEILGYMDPMLLRDSDQMSMAVGLEIRVPLLDCRVVEYAFMLPGKLKRGKPAKRLLIDAFSDLLPSECWDRPKQGFSLPMEMWLNGPMQDFFRHGLSSASKILNSDFVDEAYQDFKMGKIHWTRVWQISVLGHYCEYRL